MDDDTTLLAGENVLWRGRPADGILFQPNDVFLIPFSLLWLGLVTVMGMAAWQSGTFPFPILLFVAIGVYFSAGRFVVDMMLRRRLRYLVTDRRALVVCGGTTTSRDVRRLPALELRDRFDGIG